MLVNISITEGAWWIFLKTGGIFDSTGGPKMSNVSE